MKSNRFCKKGHDKDIVGRGDGGRCKACRTEARKARYENNKEQLIEASKAHYQKNREKILESKRIDRLNNLEECRQKDRDKYWSDPEKARQRVREYYTGHAEERCAYSREYYQRPGVKEQKSVYNHEYWHENKEDLKPKKAIHRIAYKERAREVSRLHREANKEYYIEYNKQYGQIPEVKERRRKREKANRKSNPQRHKAKRANRRNAEGTLSVQDVRDTYDMSDGICCLCLGKLVEGNTHLEHVVPINRNGTNWPSNVLLAHGYCNISKSNRTPLEYLLNWPIVTEKYNMSEVNGTDS